MQEFALGIQFFICFAKLQQFNYLPAKDTQRINLTLVEFARHYINYAERAKVVSFGGCQWHTCIKTNALSFAHHGVIKKALVFSSVRNHKYIIVQYGMGTEGKASIQILYTQADFCLYPLLIAID